MDREILPGGPWADFTLSVLLDEYSFGRLVNICSFFLERFPLEGSTICLQFLLISSAF